MSLKIVRAHTLLNHRYMFDANVHAILITRSERELKILFDTLDEKEKYIREINNTLEESFFVNEYEVKQTREDEITITLVGERNEYERNS